MNNYFQTYVYDGGIMMIALVGCAFVMVASTVQAMIRLRRGRVLPDYLLEEALKVRTKNDRLAFARDLAEQSSPLAQALELTLKELDLMAGHRPHRRRIDEVTEEAVAHVVDDMYEDLGGFSTLYSVGPLLGLLGTVLGMVRSFQDFYGLAEKDLAVLAHGVQMALINTLWGLAIAIPSYVAAQAFQGRVRRYERNLMPRKVGEIVAALYEHHPAQPDGHDHEAPLAAAGAAAE